MKVVELLGVKVNDIGSLWHDLLKNGFHVESIGVNSDTTFIYMADDEDKNPRSIVESYVGKVPPAASHAEVSSRRKEIKALLEVARKRRPGASISSRGHADLPKAQKALKIKVIIVNYGPGQLNYLDQVVSEYKKMLRHQADINIYTTVPVKYPHTFFPESSLPSHLPAPGHQLPWPSRDEMASQVENYDLFIYTENDHLITEDNIEAFLEHSKCLSEGHVSGFIQYELNPAGKKVLVVNPHWDKLTKKRTLANFQLRNVHQGCWILLKEDLKRAINSGGFLVGLHAGPYGGMEQAASDPYTQCGLTKVFPTYYDLCERLLVHHLPNKYCHYWQWVQQGVDLRGLFERHLPVETDQSEGA